MKTRNVLQPDSQIMLIAEDPLVQLGLYHLLSQFSAVVITCSLQEFKVLMLQKVAPCTHLVIAPNSVELLRMLPLIAQRWKEKTTKIVLCDGANMSLMKNLISCEYAEVLPLDVAVDVLTLRLDCALVRERNENGNILESIDNPYPMREAIVSLQILRLRSLTKSERKVLILILKGLTPTKISSLLHRDIRTISSHKRSAMKKLNISGPVGLSDLSSCQSFINELSVLSLREEVFC